MSSQGNKQQTKKTMDGFVPDDRVDNRMAKKELAANLADFILTVSRISEPDRAFTRIDMLKVRDQELCRTGTVYYTRRPCGRYEEHESEEECRAE